MGIQINGATDSITAIDGTIDVVSAIGNAGVVTATAFVGNITGNVTGNINHTGNLELQTGGVTRAHFNPSGHFAIAGITTMSGNLTIENAEPSIFFTDTNGNPDYKIFNDAGALKIYDTTYSATRLQIGPTNGEVTIASNTYFPNGITMNPGTASVVNTIAQRLGDTDTKIRFPAANTFSVETAGSERLRITSNGRVGINSTSPSTTLDVVGGAAISGGLTVGASLNASGTCTLGQTVSLNGTNPRLQFVDTNHDSDYSIYGSNGRFTVYDDTNSAERLCITSDGRLYIGAISGGNPDTDDLVITGSGKKGITLCSTDGSESRLTFADGLSGVSAVAGSILYTHSNDSLDFYTATTRRLRISGTGSQLFLGNITSVNEITETSTNSGIVIGNTSMGNGGLAIINSTSGTGRIYFGDATGSDTARNRGQINYYHNGDYMLFATAGSERLRITSTGQFLVGATSSTGARGIIQQNSSDTNPYDQATCADSSGLRLQNYSFGVGRYTALSMESCNSTTVQSASIIAQSVNSGQAPSIIFAQRTSNSANAERMRINESGYVTKISQPRAFVKIYSTTTLSNAKITNWASPTYNVGSLWDATNSRFVAPVTGLYLVGGNFRIGAPGHIRVVRFMLNAYNTSGTQMAAYGGGVGGTHNYDDGSGGYDHPYVSFTNAIYLQANQYLELHCAETSVQHTSYIQVNNEQSAMWCVLLQ